MTGCEKDFILNDLRNDDKVKVAGFDVDGILRGKVISIKKFLSIVESGFGFCSVIFGWDMHDKTYFKELSYRTPPTVIETSSLGLTSKASGEFRGKSKAHAVA